MDWGGVKVTNGLLTGEELASAEVGSRASVPPPTSKLHCSYLYLLNDDRVNQAEEGYYHH